MPNANDSAIDHIIETTLNDGLVNISISDGETESISVLTTNTRRKLLILLDMDEFRIIYPKEARLTPEYIKSELKRHKELLEFAKKYNMDQQIIAQENISHVTEMTDSIDLLNDGSKKAVLAISNFIGRIINIFRHGTSNIEALSKEFLINQKIAITVLERIVIEIRAQKEYYNIKNNENGSKELEFLIKIMEEIAYQLNNVMNSKNNNLKSHTEKYEKLGLI